MAHCVFIQFHPHATEFHFGGCWSQTLTASFHKLIFRIAPGQDKCPQRALGGRQCSLPSGGEEVPPQCPDGLIQVGTRNLERRDGLGVIERNGLCLASLKGSCFRWVEVGGGEWGCYESQADRSQQFDCFQMWLWVAEDKQTWVDLRPSLKLEKWPPQSCCVCIAHTNHSLSCFSERQPEIFFLKALKTLKCRHLIQALYGNSNC